ncbi:MAG: hypothetical protein GX442_20030 [Candidatus Riflebacteria bacterium]|nr:hypothetical protein [Candidatus Riflebacteria bacterium]
MTRRLLPLLLLSLALLAPLPGFALNEWTVLVYMVNDDDESALEDANLRNLAEMARIGAGAGSEILLQIDGRPGARFGGFLSGLFGGGNSDLKYSGGSRWVLQGSAFAREEKLDEVNMGSPMVLWEALKWAAQKHPARHYYLVVNSHGSGVFSWRGVGGTSSAYPGAVEFDPGRFVAYDDTDKDCLTVFELEAVLRAFAERLNNGRPLDVVGFDACLPASIEVLYQLRDSFAFMVGSADTTPINGFNYPAIAQRLKQEPAVKPETLAVFSAKSNNQRTMGAWRMDKAAPLTFAFNNLAMEIAKAQDEKGQKFTASGMTAYGGKDRYWNLLTLCESVRAGRTNLTGAGNAQFIRQMAEEVIEGLKAIQMSETGALTVAWPTSAEYWQFHRFYKALAFARDTKWDEVLDRREVGR